MARILIIDDNDQFRNMLCVSLEGEGYEVITACDGSEGVDLYRQEPTDLIITDINMPEKAGVEVIFELRKDFPEVKIIAMSGGTENSEGYLKDVTTFSDVKYVFSKPFDMDDMFQAIKKLLNQ